MAHQMITVSLCIKSDEQKRAAEFAIQRLNVWFLEDIGARPFPEGSLLAYNLHAVEDEETVLEEETDARNG